MSENSMDNMGRKIGETAESYMAESSIHQSPMVRRATAIGTIVATSVIEDSIIMGILKVAQKHRVPAAALSVAKSGWSLSGGLAALGIRSAITGVAGVGGAIVASTLVHLTVDIVQIVKSMPDVAVENEEDDK